MSCFKSGTENFVNFASPRESWLQALRECRLSRGMHRLWSRARNEATMNPACQTARDCEPGRLSAVPGSSIRNSRSAMWCDRVVSGGIAVLVIWTPLAFGSVHPWAYSVMEAFIFLLLAVWMLKAAMAQDRATDRFFGIDRLAVRVWALPFTLFISLILFQLPPLPPFLLRAISPQTFEYYVNAIPGWPELNEKAVEINQTSQARGDRSAADQN